MKWRKKKWKKKKVNYIPLIAQWNVKTTPVNYQIKKYNQIKYCLGTLVFVGKCSSLRVTQGFETTCFQTRLPLKKRLRFGHEKVASKHQKFQNANLALKVYFLDSEFEEHFKSRTNVGTTYTCGSQRKMNIPSENLICHICEKWFTRSASFLWRRGLKSNM